MKRRLGFTLIEVLVVVAIIAVLISILLPALGKARDKAKLAVCQTNIRGWGLGFHMYAQDNEDNLPLDGYDGTVNLPLGKNDDTYLWFNGVTAYMGVGAESYDKLQTYAATISKPLPKAGSKSFFVCSVAGEAAPGSGDSVTNGYFDTWVIYNLAGPLSQTQPMLLCYAYNSQLRNLDFPASPYPGKQVTGDISKLSKLTPAASTVLVAEKRINPNEISPLDPNYNLSLAQAKIAPNRFTGRHNKGGSIAFADGHVEWFDNRAINKGTNKATFYNLPSIPLYWNPSNY